MGTTTTTTTTDDLAQQIRHLEFRQRAFAVFNASKFWLRVEADALAVDPECAVFMELHRYGLLLTFCACLSEYALGRHAWSDMLNIVPEPREALFLDALRQAGLPVDKEKK